MKTFRRATLLEIGKFFVRGPLSAEKLGISEVFAASDPAILLHCDSNAEVEKGSQFAYMPHWANMSEEWESVCEELGFKLINPIDDVQTVTRGIKESETVITEAMHGAIAADAFRIPWIAVHSEFGDYLPFKWMD